VIAGDVLATVALLLWHILAPLHRVSLLFIGIAMVVVGVLLYRGLPRLH
jgi:hypothetical protein